MDIRRTKKGMDVSLDEHRLVTSTQVISAVTVTCETRRVQGKGVSASRLVAALNA